MLDAQETPAAASLDILRAYLSALSNRGDLASPVSVAAMRHALRRRAIPASASELLATLCMIKDAQGLAGGFYLPAPTHLVPLTDFALVVSGLPKQELQRLYGCEAISAGTGRVLQDPQTQSFEFPPSNFKDWLDAPGSTVEWTRERLQIAPFVEPHGLEGCEIFRSWAVRNAARWQRLEEHLLPKTGTILARHRGRTGQTNHYLLRTSAGSVVGMKELPHNSDDARRLQFGLRALDGDPAGFRFSTRDQETTLSLPRPPEAEQRLLTALGIVSVEPTTGVWTVRIQNYASSVVTVTLKALGLKLQDVRI